MIETKGPGGAETVFLQLVQGMAARGYGCVAAVTGPGWVKEQLENKGIVPVLLPTDGSFDLRFLSSIITCIKGHKIDLVHSHLLGANVYACLAGMLTGRKVISTFHGSKDMGDRRSVIHTLKGKIVGRGSSRVVAVSDTLKRELCAGNWLRPKKVEVIYNGIDIKKFRTDNAKDYRTSIGFAKDELLIGMIGNIRQTKGHDYFIKSAAIVKERFPGVKYLIVGHASDEDHERLVRLAGELGLENTVHFLGFRQDAHKILSCLDVFVLASTSEGFSIATVEALAAGIPVVCTRSGGPEEIITHEKDGLLVPIRDAGALTEAVCRLLADKELASRLVGEGLKTAERFSLDRMLDNYEALYAKCLGEAR
ncbi:MAG: glycosyltransferase family 4 protein [Thermodesulfobacteriota bacterium]